MCQIPTAKIIATKGSMNEINSRNKNPISRKVVSFVMHMKVGKYN